MIGKSDTIDWTAIDRRMDLQRELAKTAIAWVLADRAADDCSAALSRVADEVDQRVRKDQDPTPEDRALLGKLEYEKIGFQIADQRAQTRDEEFRQAARKLVEDLEHVAPESSTDLWGSTVPCPDCKADVRWEEWDTHLCPELARQLDAKIVDLERQLAHLRRRRVDR
jgi:hypothetical protein